MSKLRTHQLPANTLFSDFEFEESKTKAIDFPTNIQAIEQRIQTIHPGKYAKTRNYIHGAVTYLSPYITRGVISLTQVKEYVLSNFKKYESEKLLQELAWREYFQRIWQFYGDGIFSDIKQTQQQVMHHQIPSAIVNASTTIHAIDTAIEQLYETGYMHNHNRMYTAMLTCNIAKSHWQIPARWMYYHLLDGDIASNTLSWQWVAGSFSSKKYYANQENISKYNRSNQTKGYLANGYEQIAMMDVPEVLVKTTQLQLQTNLPTVSPIQSNTDLPLLVYNSYNLDPYWHKDTNANRVLLLEPKHFQQFPVSNKVLDFIIELGTTNIPNLQVFVGSFDELFAIYQANNSSTTVFYKEHPTCKHYKGNEESRTWLFPNVSGNFNSFFAYWKKAERYL
ncbi:MAG: FAD-binding domain-containing protein [Chitinophagaceae bacterium]